MSIEQHLVLQQFTLPASEEWIPNSLWWTAVRIADGYGYCFQRSVAREIKTGDAIIAGPNAGVTLRASRLCELKLDFFLVIPQHLNGLITVAELQQLERLSQAATAWFIHYAADEVFAQKFARLAARPQRESLSARSALLQLWASSVGPLFPALSDPLASRNKLVERFRELIGKMSELEMATQTLAELAAKLECSERHFSRLFRREFGVTLRTRQTEWRLQRACELLADGRAKVSSVAYGSGYRHIGLFNSTFKRKFDMTPSEWRRQTQIPQTG